MKVTIAGGGNIGTQFAVHFAEKQHEVTVYTSTPELYDGQINIVDDAGNIRHEGKIAKATDDPEIAFKEAEVVIVTMPATMMSTIAATIQKYLNPSAVIGLVPGSGGGECAFRNSIEKGNILFGIERVPAIARLVQKGKSVRSIGYRNELHVAAIPRSAAEKCAEMIEDVFEIPVKIIPNYLNLTMTPSNPILHTSRLKTMFDGWHSGVWYDRVPLFYEDWNDAASEVLFACDEEVQKICRDIKDIDLSYVKSLKDHYESYTVESMTKKISGIPAFAGLKTPMIKEANGYIPDLHSRYFTADFSYGLCIIKQIGEFAGTSTPQIDAVLEWYKSIAIEHESFSFSDYGIGDYSSLMAFYNR